MRLDVIAGRHTSHLRGEGHGSREFVWAHVVVRPAGQVPGLNLHRVTGGRTQTCRQPPGKLVYISCETCCVTAGNHRGN